MKTFLIILLVISIIWIIYLFAKTLKVSATSGSFQKKLAERKKKLENQKTREEKAQENDRRGSQKEPRFCEYVEFGF